MTGCVSDLLSFYWVMILASVSGALVIINYCVSYKAAPKAPKPQLAEMNMDMKNVTSTELPISNA